jgi:hypothetical protein
MNDGLQLCAVIVVTVLRFLDDNGHFVFNDGRTHWPEDASGGKFFRWRVACRSSMQLGSVLQVTTAGNRIVYLMCVS